MSEPQRPSASSGEHDEQAPAQGPSLALLYSLVALALIAALFFAGLIVLPFYHRR